MHDSLRQARRLLERYDGVGADGLLAGLLPEAPQASPQERLMLHELSCEAAFQANDYARALTHATQARTLASELEDQTHEALAEAWQGAALTQQSRYAEAMERLLHAIESLRTQGQEPLACRALNYLAIVHEELGDVPKALPVYERAVSMARLAGDTGMLGRALSNWGDAYVTLKDPQSAERVLREALAVVTPRNDHVHIAFCQLALGRLAFEKGDDAEALELLTQALGPAEKSGAARTLAEVLAMLGVLRTHRRETEDALVLLQRSLSMFETLGIQRELSRVHLWLSDAMEQARDLEGALQHHREHARIRGEVLEQTARTQLQAVNARHELEKARAQQEIERLRNVELAEANARLAQQTQSLLELARRDPLTGLYNRRSLGERLNDEFERARRYDSKLAVAMVDLDLFKDINDRHSHAIGDAVLQRVAELLSASIRKTDVAARYGGEEFVLVFPETGHDQAIRACEKLRRAIDEAPWAALAPKLQVTLSLGVASGTGYASWERLLSAADAKMYEAKRTGRNRVCA